MKIIEIIIALILIYATLSILVSIFVEWWSSKRKKRGNMLRQAIFRMLNDPLNLNYGQLLINHPLVSSMNNKSENRPFQYLDSGIFADALMDIIAQQADVGIPLSEEEKKEDNKTQSNKPLAMANIEKGIMQMNNSSFQRMILSMFLKSDDSYIKLKKSIEKWFDSNMERATGWYKIKMKKTLWVYGLIVALFLNIDSIHMFKVISMDENLRNNLNIVAEGVAKNYETLTPEQKQEVKWQIKILKSNVERLDTDKTDSAIVERLDKAKEAITSLEQKITQSDSAGKVHLEEANKILDISSQLGLPIGWGCDIAPASWNNFPFNCFCTKKNTQLTRPDNQLGQYLYDRNHNPDFWTFFWWVIGILITGFMLSFGAPFWFELLVKFVNIRKAGVKPLNESKLESNE